MGMPGYIVENLVSSSTPLTSSTEDSIYTLDNLYDKILAKPFKFTVTTGGWVQVDLTASESIDTLGLMGHNFDSSATIVVKADNSNPPTTVRGSPTYRENGLWVDLGSISARYVLIQITDSNTDNSYFSQLIINTRTEFSKQRFPGSHTPGIEETKVAMETERGVRYRFALFNRNEITSTWRLTETQLAEFRAFHNAVRGSQYPFLFIPNVEESDVYYVRLAEDSFMPRELAGRGGWKSYFEHVLKFSEESHGEAVNQ